MRHDKLKANPNGGAPSHKTGPAVATHRELRLRCPCRRLLPTLVVEVGKGTNTRCPRCARQVDIKVIREHDGSTFVDEHWGNRPNEAKS
jgi:hypothetical protein